jgi:hypothetical protein
VEERARWADYLAALRMLLYTGGEMRLADFESNAQATEAIRLRAAVVDHYIELTNRAEDHGDATAPPQTQTEDMCNESTTPKERAG